MQVRDKIIYRNCTFCLISTLSLLLIYLMFKHHFFNSILGIPSVKVRITKLFVIFFRKKLCLFTELFSTLVYNKYIPLPLHYTRINTYKARLQLNKSVEKWDRCKTQVMMFNSLNDAEMNIKDKKVPCKGPIYLKWYVQARLLFKNNKYTKDC